MRIKVMADYGCHALWWDADPSGRIGNIDPETLGLSPGLVAALRAWAERFDAALDMEDPANSPGLAPEEEQAFRQEGKMLAQRVGEELGEGVAVRFHA
jgi:hypothetical protein